MGHDVNGELASWDDVAPQADWSNLLLGNGFSINLWGRFDYANLYGRACDAGHLSVADQDIFAADTHPLGGHGHRIEKPPVLQA